jgi:hypothetical protein
VTQAVVLNRYEFIIVDLNFSPTGASFGCLAGRV